MSPLMMQKLKTHLTKIMGVSSKAEQLRRKQFKQLAGEDWNSPPDRFCREEKRIDPTLIGQFYGENNLNRWAVEIRRSDNGKLAVRCAYKTRSRSTWSDQSQAKSLNRYFSLVVNGDTIGGPGGLTFYRNPDGRYFLKYKNHMELVMKKV